MTKFVTNLLILTAMLQIYNRIIISIMVLIVLEACNKNEVYPIPNVPVNLIVNLNLPAYQNLNNPGGWAYINGGSRGIVIYRNFNEFVALDRHTTVHPDSACAIAEVDSINGFILNDPCSEAQYSITTGTVVTAPAKWGLRTYFTNWDGSFTLQITN